MVCGRFTPLSALIFIASVANKLAMKHPAIVEATPVSLNQFLAFHLLV